MKDFSVPSFSLGLDNDIADLSTEGEEEEEEADRPPRQPCADRRQNEECGLRGSSIQESEEIGVQESLEEAQEEDPPPRVFKRLRRGPPPPPFAAAGASRPSVDGGDLTSESAPLVSSYDDIEEFSSPEKDIKHCTDDHPSTQSHITCSNAKFSLLRRGFLRDNSECKHIASKAASASGRISTLTRLDNSNNKDIFPRLTISPIRKINLIDSDSDDSSASEGKCRKNETDISLKKGKYFHEKSSYQEAKKSLASKCQKETFWNDFSPMKSSKLETPALDEFCKEYFRSVKDQNVNQHKGGMNSSGFNSSRGLDTDVLIVKNDVLNASNNISGKVDIPWDLPSPQPPAYQYFYHKDPRIQTLVRRCLPHFIPLGAKNDAEAQQSGAKNLDYMSQFSPTFAGAKTPRIVPEKVCRSSSSKKQNKESYYNVTGSWVNPKSKTTVPKDAGKRRVSADVRRAGHWYTDQDGRKVYVSKEGEKSTGTTAYRKYRKETGGFRKAKRKAAAKKKQKSRR